MDILARRLTAVCAAVSAGMAVLVLISWALGQWQIGAFGENRVPMAPSTAWAFVLLSSAVFLRNRWPSHRATWVFAMFAVFVVAAFGLLVMAKSYTPLARLVDDWLSGSPMTPSGINAGRMTPITALTHLTLALATLMTLPPWGRCRGCRHVASLLASAGVFCALVMIAGYAMGQPTLWGTGFFPMALVTAVAFLFLGTALVCAAGTDTWPLRMFALDWSPEALRLSSKFGWVLLLVLLSTASVIGYLGFLYLSQMDAAARKRAEEEMGAIADLKINQIVAWRQERLKDGDSLFNRRFIAVRVRDYLKDSTRNELRLEISDWLTQATYRDDYDSIVLLDPQLNLRLSVSPSAEEIGPACRQVAQEAMRLKEVVLSDLHRDKHAGGIHMDLTVPLLLRQPSAGGAGMQQRFPPVPGQPPVGVLLLRINPNRVLFPLIQSWPTSSRTAETLLVRRDGDDVLYLNELRHQKGTALNLRIPVSAKKLPAAMAVRGEVGVVEGVDYRFVPVVAVLRPVPGTPWFMVAKADREEVYASLRPRA
ncbi:MAG: hypothetical protein N2689_01745, partial [Verrucomicrobiae bacterium]|nr:hypothetical protein [Verrucomicrobiae bacterium]